MAKCQTVGEQPPVAPQGLMRWLDPSTAPFIPIPEVDVDPDSGVTVGVIPTWIKTDDKNQIRQMIAPDVLHSENFGFGARGRIFAYPSDDTQWYAVAGVKQRVEREFDYEYQAGRLRDELWSFNAGLVYDRSGTPRFYGIGNRSRQSDETNYTFAQKYVQLNVGLNVSHEWQLAYTLRARGVDVERGSLDRLPSIETFFPDVYGLGPGHETLHRISLTYDSRDDTTVPTQGGEYVAYGGVAAKAGVFNASLYRVMGLDMRHIWAVKSGTAIAGHVSFRYLTGDVETPFWALSNLGGAQSVLGEAQPLRGFGTGRFYGRDGFSSSIEFRQRVLSVDGAGTHINVEVTPFVDEGQVSASSRESPVAHLHSVGGVGFRAIAAPFVVGYVDIGYGSDGAAVFTGINYPF